MGDVVPVAGRRSLRHLGDSRGFHPCSIAFPISSQVDAITVTYGAGQVLRFDTVPPLRLTDATLRMPDGSIRGPDGTGGGLPLDEWHAEFKNPP